MTETDKSKPVMITGATGYVAGWIVRKLLDEGLTVHAPVRDPENAEKLQYLNEIAAKAPGTLKFFKADLLVEGSYAEAMAGCRIVFHTASPFKLEVNDPRKELIDKFGDNYPIPRKVMPKWLVWLLAPMINKAVTRKWVSLNVNLPWKSDNSKGVRELDMQYRPMKDSMIDFFQQLIDSGQLQPAK